MYFSATTAWNYNRHCVGVARSCDVLGPYVPDEEVLICPLSKGGAIDAAGFNDNGKRYIVYKVVSKQETKSSIVNR